MTESQNDGVAVSSNFSSKEWSVYEKVLFNDYMHHKQISDLLEKQLSTEPILQILELGCGDAGVISRVLGGRKGIHYTGIDTSREALKEAKENIEHAGFAYTLIMDDIADSVAQVDGPFTFVMAGFSLHHFLPDQIRTILTACSTKMPANALLVIYDVVAREGEGRDEFNQRLMDQCANAWHSISEREHGDMANHVMANDYPLSASELTRIIEESGFNPIGAVKMLGTDDLFGFVSSRKLSAK